MTVGIIIIRLITYYIHSTFQRGEAKSSTLCLEEEGDLCHRIIYFVFYSVMIMRAMPGKCLGSWSGRG